MNKLSVAIIFDLIFDKTLIRLMGSMDLWRQCIRKRKVLKSVFQCCFDALTVPWSHVQRVLSHVVRRLHEGKAHPDACAGQEDESSIERSQEATPTPHGATCVSNLRLCQHRSRSDSAKNYQKNEIW